MKILLFQQAAGTATSPWWGIIVPSLVFILSFVVTLLLYLHFSKQHHGSSRP